MRHSYYCLDKLEVVFLFVHLLFVQLQRSDRLSFPNPSSLSQAQL